MIDGLLVLGIAVVGPLALGRRWTPWLVSAASAAVALRLSTGPLAAALVLPWVLVAVRAAVHLRAHRPERVADVVVPLAAVYIVVAALALVASRLGVTALGIHEPIVELTAVHYTYAGCAALVLAGRAGRAAAVLTGLAPPLVAFGFVSGLALPQVGGAVLLTIGVWLTASAELRVALHGGRAGPRLLLAVSGLAVWAPMVLAVLWAAGQHWAVPALSVPDMARTHGVANAVAFVGCGLVGRRLAVAA
ncbi:MAG: hypothetical protein JWN67_3380 [Actinomycetia bacterium]|nr:hypothetical protein [Actinomycetes bacterium]